MSSLVDSIRTVDRDAISVLVVDDVLPIVEEMLSLLQLIGIRAVAATSLDEAMTALAECPKISVAICDVRLGKDSGLDLIGLVRGNRKLASRDLDYVFITGDPMGIDEIPDGTSKAILTKPVMPRELIAVVRSLLDRGQAGLG